MSVGWPASRPPLFSEPGLGFSGRVQGRCTIKQQARAPGLTAPGGRLPAPLAKRASAPGHRSSGRIQGRAEVPLTREPSSDAGPACPNLRKASGPAQKFLKRQVACQAGQKSDQKCGRINISDLSLRFGRASAALGKFVPAPRPCSYILTSGPSGPGVRAGLTGPMGVQPALGPNRWVAGRGRRHVLQADRPAGRPVTGAVRSAQGLES